MVKGLSIVFLMLICAVLIGADYAFYYDCTPDKETAIFVSNVSDEQCYVRLLVFDNNGKRLHQEVLTLDPYKSVIFDLSRVVTPSPSAWGLTMLQSDGFLQISIVYSDRDLLVSRDHVIEPVTTSRDAKYYWYTLGYVNSKSFKTGFAIMNPNKVEAQGYIYIYDASGKTLKELSGTIQPYNSVYVFVSERIEEETFGVIDIRSTVPIVLGVEYFLEDKIWQIDNIVDWYTTTSW